MNAFCRSDLSGAFNPFGEATAIFLQEKTSRSEALAYDSLRLRIADGAGDPLLADTILRRREPFLGKHFD
jgi:hypothetical protein